MVERALSNLLRLAVRRAAGRRSWPWAVVGLSVYLLRRALREDGEVVSRVRVRRGQTLTVSVREQDG